MAELNRPDLQADVSNNIYTNKQRRIKGDTLKQRLLNFIDSMLNRVTDRNAEGGYLGIENGRVDQSFIKADIPQNYYLRDDGTWQPGGGGVTASSPGTAGRLVQWTGANTIANGLPMSQVELIGNKNLSNGYAGLDVNAKLPVSLFPDGVLSAMYFKGTWDATLNEIRSGDTVIDGQPMPPASALNTGWYFIVNIPGSTPVDGVSDWALGDWIVSIGDVWVKVDNTDAVVSVNGMTGAVTLNKTHIGLSNVPNVDTSNPSNITQSSSFRFATDAEKATWNGKQDALTISTVTDAAFTGSIAWTGTTAPSGTTNHRISVYRNGLTVNFIITLDYSVAGAATTNFTISNLSQLPNPQANGNFNAASTYTWLLNGRIMTNSKTSGAANISPVFRRNAANTAFEITCAPTFSSGAFQFVMITGSYICVP